jgi:hypothetical protein
MILEFPGPRLCAAAASRGAGESLRLTTLVLEFQ